MTILLTSFIIGFVAASLPGAVQMTMLQTGLSKKIKDGIRFGIGAATMDGLLLIASYFGVAQLKQKSSPKKHFGKVPCWS